MILAGWSYGQSERKEQSQMTNEKVIMLIEAKIQPQRRAELVEYSAHLIPEGGYNVMPTLSGDGILVAGDAAAMCLAAGIFL